MSDEKGHEIIIVKRVSGHGDGHHGGAWKIAFADFMTAMMALFLVLWLISATNEKTKSSIARYFNPVKLVDMTVQKRGLHDPSERQTEDADTDQPPPSKSKTDSKDPSSKKPGKSSKKPTPGEFQPTHSEGALFRDPYAVLAEIVATGPTVKPPEKPDNPNVGAATKFQDPFQTGAPEVPQRTPTPPAPAQSVEHSVTDETAPMPGPSNVPPPLAPPEVAPAKPAALAPSAPIEPPPVVKPASPETAASAPPAQAKAPPAKVTPAKAAPKTPSQQDMLATRLANELAGALGPSAKRPEIDVKPTPQGVLISLTDDVNYAMFAIGSAEPQKRTVQVMEKVAQILKKEKGKIVISGHTDARQYKTRHYDNWRLSQARAQMALYMMVRGGLEETRVERIEGDADHDLKKPNDPLAAENRRIEILLRAGGPDAGAASPGPANAAPAEAAPANAAPANPGPANAEPEDPGSGDARP